MDQSALQEQLVIELTQRMADVTADAITQALVRKIPINTPKVVIAGVGDIPYPRLRTSNPSGYKPREYSVTLDTSPFVQTIELEHHDFTDNLLSPYFKQRIQDMVQSMADYPGYRAVTRLSTLESANSYDGDTFFGSAHPYDDGIGGTGNSDNDTTATVGNVTTTGITQSEAITLLGELENEFVDLRTDSGRYPNVGYNINNAMVFGDPLNIQKFRQVTMPGAAYVGGSGATSPYAGYGTQFLGHPTLGLTKLYAFRTDLADKKPFWMPEYGQLRVFIGWPDPETGRTKIGIHRDFELQPGDWFTGVCKTLST